MNKLEEQKKYDAVAHKLSASLDPWTDWSGGASRTRISGPDNGRHVWLTLMPSGKCFLKAVEGDTQLPSPPFPGAVTDDGQIDITDCGVESLAPYTAWKLERGRNKNNLSF